jgi:hypothetical protein
MSLRFVRLIGAACLALAAACEGGPAGPQELSQDLEATLEVMAADANRDGDPDAAAAFSGGALALRLGVRPSDIVVQVGGESVRYQALVYGVVRTLRSGDLVLHRNLIAWTGERRPVALLQVSQLTDQAAFGFPADLSTAADPRGRARGTWADLLKGQRWVATAGTSAIVLASTGGPCIRQLSSNPELRCMTAEFDIRVDGDFYRLLRPDAHDVDRSRALEISTAATGVHGVVISPVTP